ncbi:type VI secretion system Vgr family protein [Stenotrophomonas forensis]|uniref:type VI secretion system Vgr family protein n=1 Tax=Stenotrophomonas forensis TaxID=2871169 RepID=UPI0039C74B71
MHTLHAHEDAALLHRLELPGAGSLLVERWHGREALSEGLDYHIDVLAAHADAACEHWLGRPATLHTRDAQGRDIPRAGLVREVRRLDGDREFTRYRIRLAAWTWWLGQQRNSGVFRDATVRQIVDAVFAEHQARACWHWSDDARARLDALPPRHYCAQYRQSDMDFVACLLAEEGIGWRVEADAEAPALHRIVLFFDSVALPQDPLSARDGALRFHRGHAAEQEDSVVQLARHARLGPRRLSMVSDDFRQGRTLAVQLPMDGGGHSPVEQYLACGAQAFESHAEGERRAVLLAQRHEAERQGWQGIATVRGLAVGRWSSISQWSPQQVPELLLTSVEHAGVNTLPARLRQHRPEHALQRDGFLPDALQRHAQQLGYAAAFHAVDRQRPWRPRAPEQEGEAQVVGRQTAIVIGPDDRSGIAEGHQVHADALGRIRVRFPLMDATGRPAHSAWLRVAQRFAGPGVGSQFLPRVGQEVLVGFLEGDVQRPIVLGALYNGRGENDPSLHAQACDMRAGGTGNLAGGNAPAWHAAGAGEQAHRHPGALWGIRSREWGGEGGSTLQFDDTDHQLRLQLATTQASTQLNLGQVIHQRGNHRGSLRGQGFELRSDAAGVVRSERGLWLGAYPAGAAQPAGTAVQAGALLAQCGTLAAAFGQSARLHGTAGLHASTALTPLRDAAMGVVAADDFGRAREAAGDTVAAGGVPHCTAPLLGMAAPLKALVAGQAVFWQAGQSLLLGAGAAGQAVVKGHARLHASQSVGVLASASSSASGCPSGMTIAAGEQPVDIQAQGDAVKLQSRQSQRLASTHAAVELAAGRALVVQVEGGASLTIEGGNIQFNCPGTLTVHAGQHSFIGPASLAYPLHTLGAAPCRARFLVRDHAGAPLAGAAYSMQLPDGRWLSGNTDGDGLTEEVVTDGPEKVGLFVDDERHEGYLRDAGNS